MSTTDSLITISPRTITFFGCGGTGINVTRSYREGEPKNNGLPGAQEQYVFVDTSIANLENIDRGDTFILKGADGSGSDRAKNAKAIKASLPDLFLKHTPGDLNVVIFGAMGGTGSVAGPMILHHLLEKGFKAVGIVIGGHETLKHTTNTIGTLMGLRDTGIATGRPPIVHYYETDVTKPNSVNNQHPRFIAGALSILASGLNSGLDSTDVGNLFDYHKVTHHAVGVAQLQVFASAEKLMEYNHKIVTLGALLKDRDQVAPPVPRDHGKVAYLPESRNGQDQSFFFAVSIAAMSDINENLLKLKAKAEQQRQVTDTVVSLGDGAKDEESGLTFF